MVVHKFGMYKDIHSANVYIISGFYGILQGNTNWKLRLPHEGSP